MSAPDTGRGPAAEGDASWTNETLSMGLRRELLERELKRYIATRNGQGQGGSASGPAAGHHESQGGRPVAGEGEGERAE